MDLNEARRRAGGMLMTGFGGTVLEGAWSSHIRDIAPAGVILFAGNYESPVQVSSLIRAAAEAAGDPDLLVSVDQEGGRVNRFKSPFTIFPTLREIGLTCNDYLAYETGVALAREMLAAGVNIDLAPVLDVDSNPANPVIGDRSFGADPYLVARMGVQMLTGMQDAGILTCGKHFPGHGDTSEDSHLKLPSVGHGIERLMELELVPFGAAVDAGIDMIMTAHVIVKGVDPANPATMSRTIIHDLLKLRFGFQGAVVSDDLEMKAIADNYGIGEAAVKSVLAGADLLLLCHKPEIQTEARDALAAAMMDGTIPIERCIDAADRVAAMKEKTRKRKIDPQCIGCEAHQRLAREIRELARG